MRFVNVEDVKKYTIPYQPVFNQSLMDIVLYFWDVVNAFPLADRKTFLNALNQTNPELSPYMNLWYAGAAPIRFRLNNGEVKMLDCSQGAIQGNPMGGVCVCYGFHVPLRKILQKVSDKVMFMADMDDLSAFCPISEAVYVCQVVKEELEKKGYVCIKIKIVLSRLLPTMMS